jgi:hypothetical protein
MFPVFAGKMEVNLISNIGDNAVEHVPPVSLPAWALRPVPEPDPTNSPAAEPVAPAIAPPAVLGEPAACSDDCATWEQAEPPGEPCAVCRSLEYWTDLRGGRHCQRCEAGKLARAFDLLHVATRIGSRKR